MLISVWREERRGAEKDGAEADFGGAFFDADFEVVGHAHRQNRQRQAKLGGEFVAEVARQGFRQCAGIDN